METGRNRFTEVETLTHLFCCCSILKTLFFQINEWVTSLNLELPPLTELYGINFKKYGKLVFDKSFN